MAAETLDLRPQIVNVKLYEGDQWYPEFVLTEPGSPTTPQDLTGATIAGTLRPKGAPDDGSEDIPLTIIDGDLTQGQFFFGQDKATVGGKYDVQIIIDTAPRTYIRGSISVLSPDITPEP